MSTTGKHISVLTRSPVGPWLILVGVWGGGGCGGGEQTNMPPTPCHALLATLCLCADPPSPCVVL
jgi:hypothetical protein